MTETRPVRTAARYGAVVALAGALITPGAALTGTTLAFADTPAATQQEAKAAVTISTEKWREGKLVLRGTGFTSTAPGRGAVFAVKFLDALPDEAHQAINPITKKGGNSPANFMATAKEDGTFEVEVSLPTPENTGLTAEQLKNKGWTVEGTSHRIQVLSGSLGGTDADGNTYDRRASVSQNITLSDPAPSPAPTAEPSATAEPTAEPSATAEPSVTAEPPADPSTTAEPTPAPTAEPTPAPTAEPTPAPSEDSKTCAPADDSFTPRLTVENPKAVQGGKLHLTGDGWCNPEDKKASVIGLKIDDGKVSRNDATAVNDNRTIWAIVTPDENGHIDAWIDLPTRDNAVFKNDEDAAKYASGEHTLRLLTGSLREGDRSGTYGGANSQGGINTTFTIGEYAPGDAPEPVNASELTAGNGVQVSRDGSTVTVTVPNAEPGTWVYAATYLGNSPQTLYGSGWKRLDGNRSFSYETSVSMPAATYRVVVHNGNQGAENAVLGFADMTVERAVTPRQDVSRDEQDATDQLVEELNENPATSTSTAPVPMRNAGGRISTRATDVDASLAALSQSTAPVVNRVQAKAKVQSAQKNLATNLQKADTSAKKAVKAAAGSKNSQNTQGSQNSAAGTKAQGPTIEGTELTGLTKWLVNNANNLLLSAAGLVVLAAALLLRTSMK
ncbi:peptidase [Rothia sp. HMSC066H02]|uniref:peptidase n=1 Tax=Rothia sp. HMSC066H02 TaxID=1739503 RepID=UPI0008A41E26|nr:peptidase [Rothia sp. HMSC066H02]OFP13621.1 peptidase [Rothia sp. HMSC066H02]